MLVIVNAAGLTETAKSARASPKPFPVSLKTSSSMVDASLGGRCCALAKIVPNLSLPPVANPWVMTVEGDKSRHF
jgi:hypothetical protein